MQAGLHKTTGLAVREAYRSGGIASFYAGFVSTLCREVPFGIIEFVLYENCKMMFKRRYHEEPGSLPISLFGAGCGAIAGIYWNVCCSISLFYYSFRCS